MTFRSGRHFLQIPGPTNVPDRVLRAMDHPTIDHRGPEFQQLGHEVLEGLKSVFRTRGPVIVYPSSGTGASEAALVNILSPNDQVLAVGNGFFASNLARIAGNLGLEVQVLDCDWRRGIDPQEVRSTLKRDRDRSIRALLVVHNETSTGVTSRIDLIREAIDRVGHPALLVVDCISSLGSIQYLHDEWGADVTIASSQKGLMLPPGLGFNAVSEKALTAYKQAGLAKSFWDWGPILRSNRQGFFPYTPATNLLYGLREAIAMLNEEGLPAVFARHHRLAEATRRAIEGWGLEIFCNVRSDRSDTLTSVRVPEGVDSDSLRSHILERFDLSLGTGLGKLAGKVFRIGHLGSMNDLMLAGTLCGVEMGMASFGVKLRSSGVARALDYLARET